MMQKISDSPQFLCYLIPNKFHILLIFGFNDTLATLKSETPVWDRVR